MKYSRIVTLVLGLGMVFSLFASGCGKSESAEKSTAGQTEADKQMRKDKKGDE